MHGLTLRALLRKDRITTDVNFEDGEQLLSHDESVEVLC